MENDRREDSHEQSTTPPLEAPHRPEARREWDRGSDEAPQESGSQPASQEQPPYESAPPTGGVPGSEGGEQPPPQGGQMGGQGRGRRRGGRGRMGPRDRRMPPRNRGGRDRDRDPRVPFQRPPIGSSHGAPHPQEGREEQRHSHSDLPPEQGSLIQQAKAEVERIREMLEVVLRDLEDVSEQLTRAEHEKDVAETEIEQLRESLRRLHR